ncbi:MAG: MFS transporter [Bacteroidaceae bacterium]|nr:MFS transporter [Bacteroidaceae bacterium]
MKQTTRNPWLWVPTLYFAEGIPYFIVNNISVLMFAKMGVPNGQMALFTSLLYLPWTIKPLWSPFVDLFKTKRWWIIAMQILMSAMFILLTLTLPHPSAEEIATGQVPMSIFMFTLILFVVTAFASATHDIAADGFYMLGLDQKQQAVFVGIRSTFYRLSNIFGQGVLVAIAGYIESNYNDIPLSWAVTLGITAVIFALVNIYHLFAMPRPSSDAPRLTGEASGKAKDIIKEFAASFVTFFRKPLVALAITFMLLYRLPEAFLLKLCTPFLVADQSVGGLGMTTEAVGLAYGTIGVFFLTIGGIIGGIMAARWGLKRSLWPMAACMTLPCLSFVYLAMAQPTSIIVISTCIAIEQFGYGFGFTAYMLYMIHFAEGEFKTSHYAICTAFMALSMMLPGMVAGYLQEWLGYELFFWMVMVCCIPTVIVTLLVSRKI